MEFFAKPPFKKTSKFGRLKHKTKAMYKTDEKTFRYWHGLFAQLQVLFDKFDERDMLHELKMKGLPIFVDKNE
jgi:hypothetical protein